MAVSPEFSDFIRDLFAEFGGVRVRRMFGGAGLFRDDVMFGLVSDGTVYLRTDAETLGAFKAEGCRRFSYRGKTKPVDLPYWTLPERLLDDPEELADWAEQAYRVALRAKSEKKGGRR